METIQQHLEAPSRLELPSKQWNSNLPILTRLEKLQDPLR